MFCEVAVVKWSKTEGWKNNLSFPRALPFKICCSHTPEEHRQMPKFDIGIHWDLFLSFLPIFVNKVT